MAGLLGQPLMPWQQLVADVGGELVDGVPAYREVIVTIPRQNGKSSLVLSWSVDRCLSWGGGQRVAYTAQHGSDARKKLVQDWVPLVGRSRLSAAVERVRRSNGDEAIEFHAGSGIYAVPSSPEAGHGRTLDLGVIDEAFADEDDRREQAMLPAMVTRPSAQLLLTSTAGTEASKYLRRKVEAGRVAVERDAGGGVAYFEWSAPDDADVDDEAVWRACMPALGFTVGVEAIRHARQTMTDDDFRRAYLNQWTAAEDRVIPQAVWDQVCRDDVVPSGRVWFGLDCTPERSSAAIVACDESGMIELVECRPGASWLPGRAVELAREWSAPVVFNGHGPVGAFRDDLPVDVVDVSGRDYGLACGALFAAVADRAVRVRRHESLDRSCAGLQRQLSGDLFTWARRSSVSDISPMVAATVAYWAACGRRGSRLFAF